LDAYQKAAAATDQRTGDADQRPRRIEFSIAIPQESKQSLLAGMACCRTLRDHDRRLVTADLDARRLDHRPLTAEERVRDAATAMSRPGVGAVTGSRGRLRR
jgi:hypothetical protein